MVTTDQVKQLRDKTGISVMQCKKALEEADGDMEKALTLLRKKSSAVAEKKSQRELGAGTIAAYVHSSGNVAAMIALSCETDFVARNENFKKLAYDIAMQVTAMNPEYVERGEVSKEKIDSIKQALTHEVEGKPENLKDKILDGKADAYLKERILLEQAFIKDSEVTIADLINTAMQKFGERIAVAEMKRVSI